MVGGRRNSETGAEALGQFESAWGFKSSTERQTAYRYARVTATR